MQLAASTSETICVVRVGSLIEETSYQAVVRLAPHEPWELHDFFGRQAGAGQDQGRIQAAFSDELEEHREILGRNRVSPLSDLIDSTAHERILPETDGAPARRPRLLTTLARHDHRSRMDDIAGFFEG